MYWKIFDHRYGWNFSYYFWYDGKYSVQKEKTRKKIILWKLHQQNLNFPTLSSFCFWCFITVGSFKLVGLDGFGSSLIWFILYIIYLYYFPKLSAKDVTLSIIPSPKTLNFASLLIFYQEFYVLQNPKKIQFHKKNPNIL